MSAFKSTASFKITCTNGAASPPLKVTSNGDIINQMRVFVTGKDVIFTINGSPVVASNDISTGLQYGEGHRIHPDGSIELYGHDLLGDVWVSAVPTDGATTVTVHVNIGHGSEA